jgi:hypothetical protein
VPDKDETTLSFNISFYSDDSGQPGTELHSFQVTPDVTPGFDLSGTPIYQFDVNLPEGVDLASGWISIQGKDGFEETTFEWVSSSQGDEASYLRIEAGAENALNHDLAFCLTSGGGKSATEPAPASNESLLERMLNGIGNFWNWINGD